MRLQRYKLKISFFFSFHCNTLSAWTRMHKILLTRAKWLSLARLPQSPAKKRTAREREGTKNDLIRAMKIPLSAKKGRKIQLRFHVSPPGRAPRNALLLLGSVRRYLSLFPSSSLLNKTQRRSRTFNSARGVEKGATVVVVVLLVAVFAN